MARAREIVIERNGDVGKLLIDGEPFPWEVHRDSVNVPVNFTDHPVVQIAITADEVRVVNAATADQAEREFRLLSRDELRKDAL